MNITSLIFLSTGIKFSQSDWLALIDNLRTRIAVSRDTRDALLNYNLNAYAHKQLE